MERADCRGSKHTATAVKRQVVATVSFMDFTPLQVLIVLLQIYELFIYFSNNFLGFGNCRSSSSRKEAPIAAKLVGNNCFSIIKKIQ